MTRNNYEVPHYVIPFIFTSSLWNPNRAKMSCRQLKCNDTNFPAARRHYFPLMSSLLCICCSNWEERAIKITFPPLSTIWLPDSRPSSQMHKNSISLSFAKKDYYEIHCILICDKVQFGRNLLRFWRNLHFSSSG